jgi:hypothetical protein
MRVPGKKGLMKEKITEAYEVLGIPLDSSISDVTKAYRRLAKKYHPDSNPENPVHALDMMMKINEAYDTLKELADMKAPVSRPSREDTGPGEYDRIFQLWQKQYEEEKKREEERVKYEQKNQEALRKFWEKVALERKYEIKDKKTHDLIVKYAFTLVAHFFKRNFHNTSFRDRPYIKRDFEKYTSIYRQYMKKIKELCRKNNSVFYRKQSLKVYKFLASFIHDALNFCNPGMERRSSALSNFQEATRISEKFVRNYFSSRPGIEKEKAIRLLQASLTGFEDFLNKFPDSPLIDYTQKKLDMLESLYKAFIKE